MGQKVNPIVFRSTNSHLSLSDISSGTNISPEHLYKDKELRDFLEYLLKSKGILLRSCQIFRSAQKLHFILDLYFSYVFSKDSKFFWAKSVFQKLKKKYSKIYKIRDLKYVLSSVKIFDESPSFANKGLIKSKEKKRLKYFNLKNLQSSKKKIIFSPFKISAGKIFQSSKLQFFFFLNKHQNNPALNLNTKKSFFVSKKALRSDKKTSFFFMKALKFNNLFSPKKASLFHQHSFVSKYKVFFNTSSLLQSSSTPTLLGLNQQLCKSLQKYVGTEALEVKLFSSQLSSLSSLKEIKSLLLKDKEINYYEKNKDLSKFFHDIYECCLFSLSTFGRGNAFIISSFIKIYLESSRKQLLLIKFLQKAINKMFTSLPSQLRAIDGIKISINGRFNKRRRTKTFLIQEGRILLQTLDSSIDYFQTSATTLYGSFGIKVWISKRQ